MISNPNETVTDTERFDYKRIVVYQHKYIAFKHQNEINMLNQNDIKTKCEEYEFNELISFIGECSMHELLELNSFYSKVPDIN